jgi:hypothetical protein
MASPSAGPSHHERRAPRGKEAHLISAYKNVEQTARLVLDDDCARLLVHVYKSLSSALDSRGLFEQCSSKA